MLQSAMVSIITDAYHDLGTIGQAALKMVAARRGQQVAEAQLSNAGLGSLFEQILSADTVRRLKPAREPYLMAAQRRGVDPAQVLLVAAHAWDVAGAMHAGCATAFGARPGMVLGPLAPEPVIVATDLEEVANTVLQQAL
jgi:2-haloacid dehalogenase